MKYELDTIDESVVTLDTYNSDLNLVIDGSKYSAQPLTKEGFAFMWAGARATHGASKGKFCFEVKVIEHLDVQHLPEDEPNPHVVRVGFSIDSTSLQLGEDPLSYGYGGTGKISTKCQFKDFGPPFIAGDCVLAVTDMSSDPVQIGFAKNGKFLGWAYKVWKSELQGKALFPHVLTKNCSFEVNFGQRDAPYFKLPDNLKDFNFIGCLPLDQRVSGTRPPAKREDCEMIMMCGLPGAGKSVWAAEYSQKHPDKKYNVLGTNNIIDKMKVMGLPRKRNYAGRWDVLIQMATKCLNSMFAIGSKLRRNYILDQTNVYPTAQRRKMRNFDGFKRTAVVVVPTEEEYKKRCDKRDREEGKEIPDSAVLEMKANFKLPEKSDIFDEVIFTELQRPEAEKLVQKYNEEGKASLGPARKQFRPNEQDSKGFDNRKGNFGYNRNDMSGGRGDMRDNYSNFPGDQGMRGPNSYGGGRGGFGDSFESRGGFNGGRGGNYGARDYSSDRGGYGDRGYDNRGGSFDSAYPGGGYDSPRGGNRGGYDGNRGGGRGGYDSNRGGGRGGYDRGRGGYDSGPGRDGFDSRGGGRGGYDSSRGGGRGGFDSQGGRGGFDGGRGSSRGGFDSSRGSSRGGFDSSRGSSRGGFDNGRGSSRGGFDSGRGSSQGGFDSSRGGFDSNRGSSRGGFDSSRGSSRGGFDSSRGSSRGGFDSSRGSSRGGFDSGRGSSRGGFDSSRGSRGGYDSSRGSSRGGYDNGRGSSRGGYDSGRGGGDSTRSGRGDYDDRGSFRDSRDTFGSSRDFERKDAYGSSTRDSASRNYGGGSGYDKSSHDTYGSSYGMSESIPAQSDYSYSDYGSGSYSSERYSGQGYGSTAASDPKRGTSTSRFGTRGATARGGSRGGYQSDSYAKETDYSSGYNSASSSDVQSSYSTRDYGYAASGYGSYKSPTSVDSYASRGAQSYSSGSTNIKTEPPAAADTASKYTQGTGYTSSGRPSRWSADTSQTAAAAAAPAVETYSSSVAQSYGYTASDPSATTYQSPPTYGYQQGSAAPASTQPWMGSTMTTTGTAATAGYGAAQSAWYGQQMSGQYYSQ